MIFTGLARIGDFLLMWPVASWYYKTHGRKIHWVLPSPLPSDRPELRVEKENLMKLRSLLEYQDFTEKVSYVPAVGGWQFNPADYGIMGDYCNFGVWWSREYDYIPSVYARRYNFGFDKDFVIKYRTLDVPVYENVWIETAMWRDNIGSLKNIIPGNAYEIKHHDDVEYNINIAMNAKNVYSNGGGFAIMMDFLKKATIIHKSRAEFEVGDKPVFRCLSFPEEGYPEHSYIWHG